MFRPNNNSTTRDGGPAQEQLRPLHFPRMEHPQLMPEQAPVRLRELLYDIAERDQPAVAHPINLFWDDEENEGDQQLIGNGMLTFNEIQAENRAANTRSKRNKILLITVGIFWLVTVALLGAICGSGHCMSRSGDNGNDSGNNPDIFSSRAPQTASPSAAPSSKPVATVTTDGNDEGFQSDGDGNIFFRPTAIPVPISPLFPTRAPTSTAKPSAVFQDATAENGTTIIEGQSMNNATISPVNLTDTNMINSTNLTTPIGNNNNITATNESSPVDIMSTTLSPSMLATHVPSNRIIAPEIPDNVSKKFSSS